MLTTPESALRRRMFLGGAAAGLFALGSAGAARAQSAASGADAAIGRLNDALLTAMKNGRSAPFRQRFDTVAAAVDQAFDLPVILQRSVGPRWSTLSQTEQAQLLAEFRRYTIANYVANFDSYSGETFRIVPENRTLAGGDQVVTTKIVPQSGSPTTLSYVMHQTSGGWKAVDVLADGSISRVAVQRSDFRTVLARGGGPALVSSLQKKVADLSDGALA
jgi:phospholipid transport system substrate-binding protein